MICFCWSHVKESSKIKPVLAMGDWCGAYDSLSPLSTDEVGWHERCWGWKGIRNPHEVIGHGVCYFQMNTTKTPGNGVISKGFHARLLPFHQNKLWTTSSRFARHIQNTSNMLTSRNLAPGDEQMFKHGSGR